MSSSTDPRVRRVALLVRDSPSPGRCQKAKPLNTLEFPGNREVPPEPTRVRTSSDGLEAFQTEQGEEPRHSFQTRWLKPFVLVTVMAAAAGGAWAYRAMALSPEMSSLTLNTTPAGAQVTVDGKAMGVTPTAMRLAAGTYGVVLTAATGQERQIAVTLRPGESVVHQVEWAEPPPAAVAATTGTLHVQTDPPGQTVFVDDTRRGMSPVTISALTPGGHSVQVIGSAGTFRRPVTITAGEMVSLVIAPNAPAVSAGWIRIASPLLLQLHVGGNLIGNTESDRVMLPTGVHEVHISNPALGYSVTRQVTVTAGRTAEVRITPPEGRLSINALPWAEVWLNGERLGPTPIANLSRPIGTHEVVLRHPQLGERRATLTVSLKDTARLGIDMRTP